MSLNSTTEPRTGALLSDVIHARMTGRLGDLLLLFLDAGISYGSGLPLERPADETTNALLGQTLERWHRETAAAQAWHDAADTVPAWLLRQQEATNE